MLRLNQRGPDDEKLSVLLDESTQRANQFCIENRWEIWTFASLMCEMCLRFLYLDVSSRHSQWQRSLDKTE